MLCTDVSRVGEGYVNYPPPATSILDVSMHINHIQDKQWYINEFRSTISQYHVVKSTYIFYLSDCHYLCKLDVLVLYDFELCFCEDGDLLPKHVGEFMMYGRFMISLYIVCICWCMFIHYISLFISFFYPV